AQQVLADGSYVFDGRSSLRVTMKQIYNRKDGGASVYFGEDYGFFHSTCGSAAFCNNIGGHDTDIRLGVQISESDIFVAVSSGSFAGNGASLSSIGFGFEKLARGEKPFESTASLFYYPGSSGTYSCPVTTAPCYLTPVGSTLDYKILRYTLGGHMAITGKPFYVNFGIAGDTGSPNVTSTLSPQTFTHSGAYLGLGVKI
ncbi:MAG: hypothetical protein M3N19_04415, partial [Candidatus Eremiobacteraeota bacterium]|nr:hypothetical protein [Candidatus Eremiobacteraeota bacterium]